MTGVPRAVTMLSRDFGIRSAKGDKKEGAEDESPSSTAAAGRASGKAWVRGDGRGRSTGSVSENGKPDSESARGQGDGKDAAVDSGRGNAVAYRGFPGAANDVWICPCDGEVENPSDRRFCESCGAIAGWARYLEGAWSERGAAKEDDVEAMEVVAPSPAAPSTSGNSDSGSPPESSGAASRAGRRTRSGSSGNSARSASDSSHRKRRKRPASCGKSRCGVMEDVRDGRPTCWACEEAPAVSEHGRELWRHFTNDESVDRAREIWSRRMASGSNRGRVKEGKEPERHHCFCYRNDCMFEMIKAWQKEEEEEEDGAVLGGKCAVCNTDERFTPRMRRPGCSLYGLTLLFSQTQAGDPGATPLGGTLEPSSVLCQKCYMKGYHFHRDCGDGRARLSVKECLEFRARFQPLPNTSVDGARSLATRKFLEILEKGDFVYLADGVRIYQEARREAGVRNRRDKSAAEDVRELFGQLKDSLSDVKSCSFSASELCVGDGRATHHYLMPVVVPSLQHAQLHVSLLEAERKLAEYREEERRRLSEVPSRPGGASAADANLAKVEEAGKIVRKEIDLHESWRNCKRGRDKKDDFKHPRPCQMQVCMSRTPHKFPQFLFPGAMYAPYF